MESLEQQFTSVLAEIEVDGRPLTETEIVHSCVVNNDFAKFTIVLPLDCLLYTSPSPRDLSTSRMPSSA